ncbi:unnamed protein product [Adineta steineri]|uniref:Uncharacterized protein n=1 Tax=Adineta steineri TaxID=433720 RepID=A0A815U391_9BILA|nr:unnamed protein product [Adineta steineri]CAF4183820.1 unnamed protein product [Adineta steineri]
MASNIIDQFSPPPSPSAPPPSPTPQLTTDAETCSEAGIHLPTTASSTMIQTDIWEEFLKMFENEKVEKNSSIIQMPLKFTGKRQHLEIEEEEDDEDNQSVAIKITIKKSKIIHQDTSTQTNNDLSMCFDYSDISN